MGYLQQKSRIKLEAKSNRMSFADDQSERERPVRCEWGKAFEMWGESARLTQNVSPKELAQRYLMDAGRTYYSIRGPFRDAHKEIPVYYYGSRPHFECIQIVDKWIENDPIESEFNLLVERWYQETGMISMLHKKAMHPAYQRIIGMGKPVLPYIFRELKKKRGHWLWALCAITGEDAALPEHNFKQAVESWLKWGEKNGYA